MFAHLPVLFCFIFCPLEKYGKYNARVVLLTAVNTLLIQISYSPEQTTSLTMKARKAFLFQKLQIF